MGLVDHRGNPIRTSELTKEQAAPSVSSIRTIWHESAASGLTPERLAEILLLVDQNENRDYLTLAEEMEERDLHYHSVLSTRKLAVSGLDTSVESFSDDPQDVKYADAVRAMVRDDAFDELVDNSLDALGKGYSVNEIMWDRSADLWMPLKYKWRDQRHFTFDRDTGTEVRLITEAEPSEGETLTPYKFIVHVPRIKSGLPIRGGLARLAAVAYMCKGYTMKDWMAFAEVFGMPLRVGEYSTNATPEQKAKLLNAVASIGTDAACIIPQGMAIKFIESQKPTGGEDMFQNLADWLNKEVSKGVLGQTATTEGTPGKLGSDDAQSKVRSDIRTSDAKQLSATLNRDLIRPFIDLNFKDRPARGAYPKLSIFTKAPEDMEALAKSLPVFIDRGLPVQASVILEKFGLDEAEEGSDLLQPKTTASGTPTYPSGEEDDGTPEGEPKTDEPSSDTDPEDMDDNTGDAAASEDQIAYKALARTIMKGETLTADQRLWMVTYSAQQSALAQSGAPPPGDDFIDGLADDELKDWKRVMDPVFNPLLDHAKASGDYQSFLAGLASVLISMDSTEFMDRVAVSGFKARGQGDATDDTD